MPHTVADCLNLSKLLENISDSARLDTEVLVAHALKKDRAWLYTWPDKVLDENAYQLFRKMLDRRQSGEPIAHIIGEKGFWDLQLIVSKRTLIPRPDTETLVELALEKINKAEAKILDLGTGTGAIALAIAKEKPQAHVLGVDFDSDIVELARENAKRNQITNAEFLISDWFSAIPEQQFDLIVSNPPYIDEQDPHLKQGDLRFEPLSALVADELGFADIEKIIINACFYLKIGGYLLIEHGFSQAEEVRQMFNLHDYSSVETYCDLSGHERVTIGQYSDLNLGIKALNA